MDWIGWLLLTAGLTLWLVGLTSGGGQIFPWGSPKVLGPFISGWVLIAAFILWEIFGRKGRFLIYQVPCDVNSVFQTV